MDDQTVVDVVPGDVQGHRWRAPVQRLMGTAEVVVRMMQPDGSGMVAQLLAVAVGQPGEAAAPHAQREVAALGIGRADVLFVRVATYDTGHRADALGGTIAALRAVWGWPVLLNQHGVVDAPVGKRVLDGLQAARFLTSCRKWLESVGLDTPVY